MEQNIDIIPFGTTRNGESVSLFRIPNSTNDYIELSTYGCALKSVCIHTSDGSMQNVLAEPSSLAEDEASPAFRGVVSLEDSELSGALSHAVWNVAETGENHVFLTCRVRAGTGEIAVGARVMWVNLNRLVMDLFVTPEHDAALNICSELMLRAGSAGGYALRTFCPKYRAGGEWQTVAQSPYRDLQFQSLTGAVCFSAPEGSGVGPMAELTEPAVQTAISIYGNLPLVSVTPRADSVQILQTLAEPAALQGGQTCCGRIIFGFDRLFTAEELTNPAPSPFSAFI
ncbi:hypothetical protein [uncultured Oscillibacter sp.]|jgi:hypothetical protein|uniref:hypothetical protein n=1 Tax=uncultured Oscillibacter sp. TaxID=876091 RepID=UPI0025FEDD1E|nr:hypothetical protein [uncultured Oscillibacter sp.]MCX4371493.1 hypothetical protein [Dysosmobacter sp.]